MKYRNQYFMKTNPTMTWRGNLLFETREDAIEVAERNMKTYRDAATGPEDEVSFYVNEVPDGVE